MMVDVFDKFHSFITNKGKLERYLFISYMGAIVVRVLNLIAPVYFSLTQNNIKYRLEPCFKEKERVIVTLTSFPSRINNLWLAIETILRQSIKPDKIVLWLSLDQFDSLDSLPKKIKEQMSRGLEVRLVFDDLKSHKKYYYALKEFPNDKLIIIDDDIFYDSRMVGNLIKYSDLYPNTIIARYCKKMLWENRSLVSYHKMDKILNEEPPGQSAFFGSGGGTLISSQMLDQDVLNIELFTKLTPTADDIWLNTMCRLKETNIKCIGHLTNYLGIKNKIKTTLDSINNGQSQNDVQINNVIKHYLNCRNINPFKYKC